MINIKRCLITGATGYIGSNLARKLLENGDEVHILTRPSSNLELINDISSKLYIYSFDKDTKELIDIINQIQPDIIFHLASLFIAEHNPCDVKFLINSNILFGTQLLEAATVVGVKYFINTGTYWQHYNTPEYCPSDLYAATKQAFESIANYYVSAFDLKFVTLKLIDTYGPFDPRPKVISVLKKAAKIGQGIGITGGEQQLGLLYIDDVVKAFLLTADYAKTMPTHFQKSFIAAPKDIYTLKEIVEIFQRAWGSKVNIELGKRPYKEREVMKVCCDDENILSNVETVGLYDGLKRIFETECEKNRMGTCKWI